MEHTTSTAESLFSMLGMKPAQLAEFVEDMTEVQRVCLVMYAVALQYHSSLIRHIMHQLARLADPRIVVACRFLVEQCIRDHVMPYTSSDGTPSLRLLMPFEVQALSEFLVVLESDPRLLPDQPLQLQKQQ